MHERSTLARAPAQRAAAIGAASLGWLLCAAQVGPLAGVAPGRDFSLRPGESVAIGDGSVRIGFEGVTADSRCPRGEQCVVAGDATVRLRIQHASGLEETGELHAAASRAEPLRIADRWLRLVRLEPEPVSGKATRPADYLATFAFGDAAAPASDR